MLVRTKGNILDLAEDGFFNVIVHGCNCQNTMGSGIAKQIRDRCPGAYDTDQRTVKGDPDKLGTYSVFHGPRYTVVNAYTQYHYLPRGKDHFSYHGFRDILKQLAVDFGDIKYSIAFPYIGMGLAGGNPAAIIPMIEDFANSVEAKVTLVEYNC